MSKEEETGDDKATVEFVTTISHELRTPLTVVKEAVSLILEGAMGPLTAKQWQFLGIALRHIDQLAIVIDELVDKHAESTRIAVGQ